MRKAAAISLLGVCALPVASGCDVGTGTGYVREPAMPLGPTLAAQALPPAQLPPAQARTIGGRPDPRVTVGGRSLGIFRNTYYDFPSEGDFSGTTVKLMTAACQPIAEVPRAFHDALCVQGSGSLKKGGTVSFAKRDCACAEVCPRTGQRICYDALDRTKFPFGRGAAGTPIMPLVTVAADTTVLPLGTPIYLPELDGLPMPGGEPLDGCFVVEDRGSRVKGDHVDIFTGSPKTTRMLNERVPSNEGVTVVVEVAKCERLKRRL